MEERPEQEMPLDTRWIDTPLKGGRDKRIEQLDRELIYQLRAPIGSPVPQQEDPFSVRLADKIASFSGSVPFFFLNAGWFLLWIAVNTILPKTFHFDPFPFQFLTMAVSLEAIFLSIFVLISENRQAAKDRMMMEKDFETNQRAEQENRVLLERIIKIEELLRNRSTKKEDSQ